MFKDKHTSASPCLQCCRVFRQQDPTLYMSLTSSDTPPPTRPSLWILYQKYPNNHGAGFQKSDPVGPIPIRPQLFLSTCQVSIIMKVVCNVFTATRPWKTALYADRPHRFIYNPATYTVYSVSICFAFSLIGVLFFIIFTKVCLLPIMEFHTKGLHPLSRLNIFR